MLGMSAVGLHGYQRLPVLREMLIRGMFELSALQCPRIMTIRPESSGQGRMNSEIRGCHMCEAPRFQDVAPVLGI